MSGENGWFYFASLPSRAEEKPAAAGTFRQRPCLGELAFMKERGLP